MKHLCLFLFLFAISCKKDSPVKEDDQSFIGQYFYAAKDKEGGMDGPMDIIISVTVNNGKHFINIEDDFADPSDLGEARVSGNVLTATQHVDDGYDTRDLTLTMTKEGSITKFVYDVDFIQATGDFHIEGILTKQ